MSYKKAQVFQDYMSRSNRFVDRILAGGNRLPADAIMCESDVEMLLAALERMKEVRAERSDRFQRLKQEKAYINNETKGRPIPS